MSMIFLKKNKTSMNVKIYSVIGMGCRARRGVLLRRAVLRRSSVLVCGRSGYLLPLHPGRGFTHRYLWISAFTRLE